MASHARLPEPTHPIRVAADSVGCAGIGWTVDPDKPFTNNHLGRCWLFRSCRSGHSWSYVFSQPYSGHKDVRLHHVIPPAPTVVLRDTQGVRANDALIYEKVRAGVVGWKTVPTLGVLQLVPVRSARTYCPVCFSSSSPSAPVCTTNTTDSFRNLLSATNLLRWW